MPTSEAPSRLRLILAFAAIYIIWSSSYLGIRFAIETLPPFMMAGARFVTAGLILYAWARHKGVPAPTHAEWKAALIAGGLLFLANNGLLLWAQQTVPSGITSLIIASTPIWIVLIDWLRPGGTRPNIMVFIGLGFGFLGMALLISPDRFGGGSNNMLPGILALMVAAAAWAAGSMYSRHAPQPQSPLQSTGMQLLTGGGMLFILGLLTGESATFHISQVSLKSAFAWVYLLIFASLIAFSAFVWLMRVSTPARVSTYAYVNPVGAMFLGWLLADEPLTERTVVAAAIIISAVMLINLSRFGTLSFAARVCDKLTFGRIHLAGHPEVLH